MLSEFGTTLVLIAIVVLVLTGIWIVGGHVALAAALAILLI